MDGHETTPWCSGSGRATTVRNRPPGGERTRQPVTLELITVSRFMVRRVYQPVPAVGTTVSRRREASVRENHEPGVGSADGRRDLLDDRRGDCAVQGQRHE